MTGGGIAFDVSGLTLDRLKAGAAQAKPEALAEAAEHLRRAAVELTPVLTGKLAASAAVTVEDDRAAVTYDGPYARYQHEGLGFRHEHGQAKYLEQPVTTEKDAIFGILARRVKDAL